MTQPIPDQDNPFKKPAPAFRALNVHILTVTDTRSAKEDGSGNYLANAVQAAEHVLHSRDWVRDELYDIRAKVSVAIANAEIDVILITGGTGMFPRDVTPDAVEILFDKQIVGFGEMFRMISYEEIGMSTIQSRATAGIANKTLIFCLPGSTGACRTAWEKIIQKQLDPRIESCGFTRVFNMWDKA
ncbi:molybdenum cofactor biosynthesis protein B [Neisseriaceae bacterium B1]